MSSVDINTIRKHLPHRYPFLLIDRVLDYEVEERLTALKNVTVNEPFFNGHFPHRPVMPGVLILEAMAQASALLVSIGMGAEADDKRVYLFAGVDKLRFKQQVIPGDQLIIEVVLLRRIRKIWKCGVSATVDDRVVSSAELMFTYQDV